MRRRRERLPVRMRARIHGFQLSASRRPLRLQSVPQRRTMYHHPSSVILRVFVSAGVHGPALRKLCGLVRRGAGTQSLSARGHVRAERQPVRVPMSTRLGRTQLRHSQHVLRRARRQQRSVKNDNVRFQADWSLVRRDNCPLVQANSAFYPPWDGK